MELNFRAATDRDAEAIARLHAESWRITYRGILRDAYLDHDVFADRLAVWKQRFGDPSPRRLVLVAERGGTIAGFICVYGGDHPQWGSLIDNLHVSPELKRSGIGAALMREASGWLGTHHPAVGVYLGVMEANAPACRFYEKLGARDDGAEEMGASGGDTASVWKPRSAFGGVLIGRERVKKLATPKRTRGRRAHG